MRHHVDEDCLPALPERFGFLGGNDARAFQRRGCRTAVIVGAIVVRLNQEGFTESDRLYGMRDGLAQGRPVDRGDLDWLNTIIATERGLQTGS